MSNGANHNCRTVAAAVSTAESDGYANVDHIYVHIPFCARICPYCAFYKDLLDRSQTSRFCDAILRELDNSLAVRRKDGRPTEEADASIDPSTIYFGGGTPTALNLTQLESLLRGFNERLELSQLVEWTIEANPGSVSARKAALLKRFGVNRISLGVQSWDEEMLKLLGREHDARQAEESFQILRSGGFKNINVDLMFGLPGQTADQWRATLRKTIALQPEHISTYCLTYEEDTEFFLRHARGEFREDTDADADLFEMTISILEKAGYEQYEISNYARRSFESVHNRAYWMGKDYLGLGPSAVSTVGMQRWQNVCDYRAYIDLLLSGKSARGSSEDLTDEMKRTERVALGLRTREGIAASELKGLGQDINQLVTLKLLRKSNDNLLLTRKGKAVADSVAEVLL